MNLKRTAPFLLLLLLVSCKTLYVSTGAPKIERLAINWQVTDKVNEIYAGPIDAVFERVIARFNSGKHSFRLVNDSSKDAENLTFTFDFGKYVTNGEKTAGYIISGIGLVATPVLTYKLSKGAFSAFFYYLPNDKLSFSGILSAGLNKEQIPTRFPVLTSSAMFKNNKRRISKMGKRLEKEIYRILVKLDKELSKSVKHESPEMNL